MLELFIDLYRYRQRERKNNLEDWLTECLAATLRSLDRNQWIRFLVEFSRLEPNRAAELVKSELPIVRTQVQAGAEFGIPDLVIFAGDEPFILFENKVAHRVTEDLDDSGQIRNQLHRYAEWLHKRRLPDVGDTCLVFLTHITPPPEDFLSPSHGHLYHNVRRITSTWGHLGRLLRAIAQDEGQRSLACGLSRAFYKMLEDEQMANEFPTSTALASLEVFLAQGAEIENLLKAMWNEISGVAKSSNTSRERIESEFEFGRYSAWRYVNWIERVSTKTAFLMTGIWFPEIADTWPRESLEGLDPHGPQIFLCFGDDDYDVFKTVEGKPSDQWLRPYSDFLRMAPLHQFSGTPDQRASNILKWLAQEAKDLRTFLLKEELTLI